MSYRPIIAIIGRPNVGKSSLFNRLVGQRQAIVAPVSGTTRDRLYATATIGETAVDLVDTAGLSADLETQEFGHEMIEQVQLAVQEADILVFVVDAQVGLTSEDQQLAEIIRKSQTPTILFVNKVDDLGAAVDPLLLSLGLGETVLGSLTQRRGHLELQEEIIKQLKTLKLDHEVEENKEKYPRITLAGRPNVGKSTLLNAFLNDHRVIVSDIPGTTRDTIDTKLEFEDGTGLLFSDTAGLRRRGKIGRSPKVEQYSVLRTLKAIDESDLVLVIVDGEEGLTRGDVHVADYALQQKKRLITVINKCDLIDTEKFYFRRFPFLTRHPMIFISAKEKFNLGELLELIQTELHKTDETPDQNSLLER